jgi:hypothetical protein
MRTTLTLDDDVEVMLNRFRQSRKVGLKEAVNLALRTGLQRLEEKPEKRRDFRTKPADLGSCLAGSIDSVHDVLAVAEGENYR